MFSYLNKFKEKINQLIINKTDSIIKSESLKSEDIFFEEYLSYIIFISSGGILFAIEIITSLIDNKTDLLIQSELSKTEDVLFEEYLLYIIFVSSYCILLANDIITSYVTPGYTRSYYLTAFLLIYILYFTAEFYSITNFSKKLYLSRMLLKLNFKNEFIYKTAKKRFIKVRSRQIENMTRIYSRAKGDRIIKWTYAISSVIISYICFNFFSVETNSNDLISFDLINYILPIFIIVFFALTTHKSIAEKIYTPMS